MKESKEAEPLGLPILGQPDTHRYLEWPLSERVNGPVARVFFYNVAPFEPPVVEFDAQGAARVPQVYWTNSSGDVTSYTFRKGLVTVHASAIQRMSCAHVVLGRRLLVDGILGTTGYAYVQFDPFEASWIALRHQYGLRLPKVP